MNTFDLMEAEKVMFFFLLGAFIANVWLIFRNRRILDEAKELYEQSKELDLEVTQKIKEENMVLVLHYKAVLEVAKQMEYFELCKLIHEKISDKTDFQKVDPIEGIYLIYQPNGVGVIFDEELKK
jgi:hypothetical protein